MPLKRRMRLRGEIADGDVETEATQIAAAIEQHPTGLGNAEHIGIGLTRQPDHEIELHLAEAVLHCRADSIHKICIREPFVHDVSQPLGAGFRCKRQARLAGAPKDVSDVVIKTIHPLTGQLKRDIAISETITKLYPHSGQRQVIAAAQRQQRKVAVTRSLHSRFNRLNHGLRLHVPRWSRQHSRLTKTTASGATTTNFHRQSVMHGLHMGNESHRVMGHGRSNTPQQAVRKTVLQRLHADPLLIRSVERRHINPWDNSQVTKQVRSRQARSFGFCHHQSNLREKLLPIA